MPGGVIVIANVVPAPTERTTFPLSFHLSKRASLSPIPFWGRTPQQTPQSYYPRMAMIVWSCSGALKFGTLWQLA